MTSFEKKSFFNATYSVWTSCHSFNHMCDFVDIFIICVSTWKVFSLFKSGQKEIYLIFMYTEGRQNMSNCTYIHYRNVSRGVKWSSIMIIITSWDPRSDSPNERKWSRISSFKERKKKRMIKKCFSQNRNKFGT